MRKTFELGKIDYANKGRKAYPATVTIELRNNENGLPVFSAMGTIYNTTRTDSYCAGQCLDTIAKYVHSELFNNIYRLWNMYHLNDMHAGTPEQENALKNCPSKDYGERCEYLKGVGLYEVEVNGEPYKYGHKWLYNAIPDEDMSIILELLQ